MWQLTIVTSWEFIKFVPNPNVGTKSYSEFCALRNSYGIRHSYWWKIFIIYIIINNNNNNNIHINKYIQITENN